MAQTTEQNIGATGDVLVSFRRLEALGLANGEPRGVNQQGIVAACDLMAVLIFQTGSGESDVEQVMSATARAALAALGDLLAFVGDEPTDGSDTLRLLAAATKRARQ